MLQIKLPTKLTFWTVAAGVAGILGYVVESGLVPAQYAGVVTALAGLVGAVLQHKPAGEP